MATSKQGGRQRVNLSQWCAQLRPKSWVPLTPLLGVLACGAPATFEDELDWQSSAQLGSPLVTPTDVDTLAELQSMTKTGNYRLTANIDASSGFTPLEFSGTFDGNGFSIQNLTIDLPNASDVALFGMLTNAIVTNVRLTNVNIMGRAHVGGLAGTSFESQITQSSVDGAVRSGSSSVAGADVGLFAGYMHGGSVTRSYATGTVTGWMNNVGGFIGRATGSVLQTAVVKECYANAALTPNTTNALLNITSGGLIGYASGMDVSDVYALGSVRGRGAGVGGVIGQILSEQARPIKFYNSYSRNIVTDSAGPDRGAAYGSLTGATARLDGLLWDSTVDPAPVHPSAGQNGASTSALRSPTTGNAAPYVNWSTTAWDGGTTQQYHGLRNVVRASTQPR